MKKGMHKMRGMKCVKWMKWKGMRRLIAVLLLSAVLLAEPVTAHAEKKPKQEVLSEQEQDDPAKAKAVKAGKDYKWKKSGNDWYLLTPKKKPVTGWARKDKIWYYFSKDGVMQTGWVKNNKKWYYMNSDGAMQTGWVQDGTTWYYLDENGIMKTGWLKQGKKKYYLQKSGAMTVGWKRISKKWYYFKSNGNMSTGWTEVEGEKYRLTEAGVMKTGWIKENGEYFYLSSSGVMAHDGWLVKKGHWYHFNSDGKMDQDETEEQALVSMPGYYISPMKAGKYNSRKERIEAMIERAYEYKNAGTTYQICKSQKPGQYADCSGLVMQCLYAAGFDPAPATPAHHARPENEYDSRTLYYKVPMKKVSYVDKRRGDLIFYNKPGTNTIIHVAIYLGNNRVIESWPPAVTDKYGINSSPHTSVFAVLRPFE